MNPEQLQQLTDEGLEQYRVAMFDELDRRNKLRDIPNEIKKMAQNYEQLGGHKTDLVAKINEEPVAPELPPEAQPDYLPEDVADDTIQDTTNNEETNDGITDSPTGA